MNFKRRDTRKKIDERNQNKPQKPRKLVTKTRLQSFETNTKVRLKIMRAFQKQSTILIVFQYMRNTKRFCADQKCMCLFYFFTNIPMARTRGATIAKRNLV